MSLGKVLNLLNKVRNSDSMSADDQKVMVEKRRELRSAGDEAAVLLTGEEATWSTGKYWYADPMINEYQYSWQ